MWELGEIADGEAYSFKNLHSVGFDESTKPDIYYSGNFKGGKFEDPAGVMGWNDESYFKGEFKNGLREGAGVFVSENMDKSNCMSKANKLTKIVAS